MSAFQDLINSNTPTLVDFYAEWCGPCKAMKPILEQVKQSVGEKARIVKIDVDHNPAIAQKFQIQGVPTLILFKNGKAIWRQSGVVQAQALKSLIESKA